MFSPIGIVWVFMIIPASLGYKIRIGGLFLKQEKSDETTLEQDSETGLFHPFLSETDAKSDVRNFALHSKFAFEFAILSLNQRYAANSTFTTFMQSYEDNSQRGFQMTKKVCSQLYVGVAAIVTAVNSDVIQSICNAKHMAHIHVGKSEQSIQKTSGKSMAWKSDAIYTIKLSPSLEIWNTAVIDLVLHYKWKKVALLYCGDLSRLQPLLDVLSRMHNNDLTLLQVKPIERLHLTLLLQLILERRIKNIIVDCEEYSSLFVILRRALEFGLLESEYHYILFGANSHLLLERNLLTFGQRNITAFSLFHEKSEDLRLVQNHWNTFISTRTSDGVNKKMYDRNSGSVLPLSTFTVEVALMFDALSMYAAVLSKLTSNPLHHFNHRSLPCDSDGIWLFGKTLMRALRNSSYPGLTGTISFDEQGERTKVKMAVVTATYTKVKKIGEWTSMVDTKSGSRNRKSGNSNPKRLEMFDGVTTKTNFNDSKSFFKNRSLVVTTILVEPYMFRENIPIDNNGNFEVKYSGYCKDLLDHLSEELEFLYNITEVQDKAYGSKSTEDGSWNGMIGELMHGHADMAVAPLTITYDREKAVKFTKPYMSLGVSILYRTPSVGNPNLFGFFKPLSILIWILVFVSYVSVALIMFCIARLSPHEWQDSSASGTGLEQVENNFGFLDSLWFGIGALMQQGSDISPRSISTRLLAGVWWFFILILISSYTANLAAFLTVTRLETEITNVDDLASQTAIKYGTLKGQATAAFFKNSKLPTYSKMWRFMNQSDDVLVPNDKAGIERVLNGDYAYLMESSTLEYLVHQNCNLTQVGGLLDTRGYGIATMESKLRDELSVAILKLQENGVLDELKHRWWKSNAIECPKEDTSSTKSLTVANLGGAFVFLCIGACVAILTAIIEFCTHSYFNAKTKKKKLRKELKLGLATICSCRGQVKKAPFFERSSHPKNDSLIEMSLCDCHLCIPRNDGKKTKEAICKQRVFPDCNSGETIQSQKQSSRYCKHFTAMVETVLNDHVTVKPHGCLSLPTECMTSSLTSSKDPNSTLLSSCSQRVARQLNCPNFDSDAVSSSFSLPGCSPRTGQRRIKESRKQEFSLPKFDNLPCHSGRTNRSNLRREDSEIRRWKFANGRSFRFRNEIDGDGSVEYLPTNSSSDYVDNRKSEEVLNGVESTLVFDLKSLKQTDM